MKLQIRNPVIKILMQAVKRSAKNRCTFRCLEMKLNILRGEMNKMYHRLNVEAQRQKRSQHWFGNRRQYTFQCWQLSL